MPPATRPGALPLACLGMVFTVLTLLSLCPEAPAAPPLAGRLVFLQGEVQVRPGGGGAFAPAALNQDLFAGDVVKTGSLSRAAILCVDESQIKLNENTLFALKSALPSPRLKLGAVVPAAAEPASLYGVSQGEMWLRNANEKFRFELETPAVTAAIRGTEFNLKVAADGTTNLVLLHGLLSLANAQGRVDLNPGEEGSARPGQAPTKRVLLTPEDAVQWSLYYPGIFSFRDLPLSSGGESPASPMAREAAAAYDRSDLAGARGQAEAAVAKNPKDPQALTVLGWVQLQGHAPTEAEGCFRRVQPPTAMSAIGLALARYRQGDVAGAYALSQTALKTLPPSATLTVMAGYFALLAGRVPEARNLLETAARQGSAVLAPAFLAQIELVQNRKAAARREAAQALAQGPGSPLALLTMALVDIAHFDLNQARSRLTQSLKNDPAFVQAYVYLARLWLGSDYLDRAWATIRQALHLAPREGEVLALAGFVRLGFRDYEPARQFFERAAKATPGLGDPHLGLGHYHFRFRDFAQGLAEILTATLLEPRISLYQSDLGRALYQARSFDKALEVYDYAKTLDPRDPTPHLYKGIALTDLYRPGEAIEEINRSIALNDNRAVFRSRLLLDRDLAVRNYNLARAYSLLGLGEWAYSKAVTAVKSDPINPSAHLFLAGSYLITRQRVAAAGSELLLYRLLSPANQNTFTQFNDYTPMFEMPYFRVNVQGGVGAWDRAQAIQEHNIDVYGGKPGLAFDVFAGYNRDPGYRENTDNSSYSSINRVKWEPSVKTSLLGGFLYFDGESGDLLNLGDPSFRNRPNLRQYFHLRETEAGFVHRFSPAAVAIGYFNYASRDFHLNDRFFFPNVFQVGGIPVDLRESQQERLDREHYNLQFQQQVVLGSHTFLGGVNYFSGTFNNRSEQIFDFLLRGTNLSLTALFKDDFQPPDRALSFYLLDYWRLKPNLIAELGLFYDSAKVHRAGFPQSINLVRWSPQFGLNWLATPQHTFRLALSRHLNTQTAAPSLIPQDVAGFPWQVNIDDGALLREAGLAWEAQWTPRTFSVLRLSGLRVDSPQYDVSFNDLDGHQVWLGYKKYTASVALNHILTPSLGLAVGSFFNRVFFDEGSQRLLDARFQNYTESTSFAALNFLHRTGWFFGVNGTLTYQHLRDRNDPLFGLMDVRLGKYFDNKRGLLSLEVTNLFNRSFFYLKAPVFLDTSFPERRALLRLQLWF